MTGQFAFSEFRVDLDAQRLWHGDQEIPLRPKTFAVLRHLLERAGELVTVEGLLQAVWPGVMIDEAGPRMCIRELRRALGDDVKKSRFIETKPGRGYRFIGTVVSGQSSVVSPPPTPSPHSQLATGNWKLPTDFVGRDQEMAELQTSLEAALSGQGRLMLLSGEPGIGKTRIAEELAQVARSRNAQVYVGRCYEGEGAPPFWPWLQIVRSYLAACDPGTVRTAMGAGAAVIAEVLPDIRSSFPNIPTPPTLESESARFRFFDSFTTFLRNAAKANPLVLVLDDLHWADSSSLLLLQFLARALTDARLLIIGAYRDGALAPENPLTQSLGVLTRVSGCQTLTLPCLSESEVARFIELTTAQAPSPSLTAAIFQQTGGNPFFVTEIVHTLMQENRVAQSEELSGEPLPLPQRVRVAVSQRLSMLTEPCRRVLMTASVIGTDFDLALLESVERQVSASFARDRLLKILAEAMTAHFIIAESRSVGRYGFSHALVREAIYEALSADQRVHLHRRIGETLERLSGIAAASSPTTISEQMLSELAFHFFQAAPGGDVGKAILYALHAGARATAAFAHEEAAHHYERALQLLPLQHQHDTQHCKLLLALGEAQRRAGKTAAAKDTFQQAATLARTLRGREKDELAAALLARAALGFATGFGGITVTGGVEEAFIIELLEEAVRELGENDSALRAQALSRLAVELYWSHERERRAALSQQAVEIARRLKNATALAHALHAHHVALREPGNVEERLLIANEIVKLADEVRDKELALRGRMWRLSDLLELGELQTADREIAGFAQRAEELRQPSYLWFLATWRAIRAWLKGRFAEAERFALEALDIGQRAQDPDAAQCYIVQIFALRSGVKGFHDIEMPVQDFAERYTALPAWRSSLALTYAGFGAKEEARREFEQFAVHDFTHIPLNADWMITMTNLVQVCVILRDAPRAATLYQLLLPYAERCAIVGPALVCLGPVTRFLGLLATTLMQWEEAEAHFVSALQRCTEMDAKPLIAQTQQHYAGMLLARKLPGDQDRALTVLDHAFTLAQEIGMDELAQRIFARRSKILPPTLR